MRLILPALCLLMLRPAHLFGQDIVQSVFEDLPSRLECWDSAADWGERLSLAGARWNSATLGRRVLGAIRDSAM